MDFLKFLLLRNLLQRNGDNEYNSRLTKILTFFWLFGDHNSSSNRD